MNWHFWKKKEVPASYDPGTNTEQQLLVALIEMIQTTGKLCDEYLKRYDQEGRETFLRAIRQVLDSGLNETVVAAASSALSGIEDKEIAEYIIWHLAKEIVEIHLQILEIWQKSIQHHFSTATLDSFITAHEATHPITGVEAICNFVASEKLKIEQQDHPRENVKNSQRTSYEQTSRFCQKIREGEKLIDGFCEEAGVKYVFEKNTLTHIIFFGLNLIYEELLYSSEPDHSEELRKLHERSVSISREKRMMWLSSIVSKELRNACDIAAQNLENIALDAFMFFEIERGSNESMNVISTSMLDAIQPNGLDSFVEVIKAFMDSPLGLHTPDEKTIQKWRESRNGTH